MYRDIEVPVLERNWEGQSMPYVWVINLKPGETWHHAKVTTKKLPTECYVQTPEGFIPPGALAARGLIVEGASLAFSPECSRLSLTSASSAMLSSTFPISWSLKIRTKTLTSSQS